MWGKQKEKILIIGGFNKAKSLANSLIKKGYENTSLCYCMIVESNEDILYVKKIVQN